jgi:hypothetical protein
MILEKKTLHLFTIFSNWFFIIGKSNKLNAEETRASILEEVAVEYRE